MKFRKNDSERKYRKRISTRKKKKNIELITNLMNSLSISFSKAVELLKVSKDKVLEIEKYFKS